MSFIKIKHLIIFMFAIAMLSTLSACGGSDNESVDSAKATSELPSGLQKLTLSGGGTLNAYVIIDDDTENRITMTIDGTGAGSASASIPNLSRSVHTVTISYEYTDGTGTIVLATATSSVDLSSGSASLGFAAGDYDLDSHDEDGDGISNAAELAAGSDPRDGDCVVGSSVIGSCTIG